MNMCKIIKKRESDILFLRCNFNIWTKPWYSHNQVLHETSRKNQHTQKYMHSTNQQHQHTQGVWITELDIITTQEIKSIVHRFILTRVGKLIYHTVESCVINSMSHCLYFLHIVVETTKNLIYTLFLR